MNTCPSCGGIIGRDCWNPRECAEITAQMQRDAKQPPPTNSTEALEAIAEYERRSEQARKVLDRFVAVEAENIALREENARLREGLERADAALRDYACHAGPDVPCVRSMDQCAAECGQHAGDALLAVHQALTTPSKDQDQ